MTSAETVAFDSAGEPLTASDVARMKARTTDSPIPFPEDRIPKYATGNRLFNRDELLALFESHHGRGQVNDGDVNTFLKDHFTVSGQGIDHIVPTDTLPFPALPDIADDVDDRTRQQIIRDHEERRRISRRSRQVFRIDGLPKYVPSNSFPSSNDSPAVAKQKAERINAL